MVQVSLIYLVIWLNANINQTKKSITDRIYPEGLYLMSPFRKNETSRG